MKPVIHTFDLNAGQPLNGAYKLGVLPKGYTHWSHHVGFVNGRPTVTLIGMEPDEPKEPPTTP
jgi:hypothetical protein